MEHFYCLQIRLFVVLYNHNQSSNLNLKERRLAMKKAKRIKRMEITMSMDEIIKHLEKLRWLLRHNRKLDPKRYPGLTNLSEIDAECVCDHINDTFRYLDNIPGTTIYDFFSDDDFKAYGIH